MMSGGVLILLFVGVLVIAARLFLRPERPPPVLPDDGPTEDETVKRLSRTRATQALSTPSEHPTAAQAEHVVRRSEGDRP